MIFKRFIGVVLVITGIQTSHSQYTDLINSNRPGESFGAFSVGKTIFQTEGGLSYVNEKHSDTDTKISGMFVDLDIRYGFLLEELEFIADLQYRVDTYKTNAESMERSSINTAVLGLKYLAYDPFKNYEEELNLKSWKYNNRFRWRQFVPAVAVYAGANLNFTNDFLPKEQTEIITYKGMIILQNHFQGGWVFVTNFMADHIASDYLTFGGILTITKSLNYEWSGFAEIQGYKSDFYEDLIIRGGAVYLLNPNLQLDISVGKNLHDTRDIIFGGIGASWRFAMNYKDVKLDKKTPKDGKKKKKKKKKNEVAPEIIQEESGTQTEE